jgi:hypothetical protein
VERAGQGALATSRVEGLVACLAQGLAVAALCVALVAALLVVLD